MICQCLHFVEKVVYVLAEFCFIEYITLKVMLFFSKKLARFLKRWPGEKYLGIYRFMPIFFALGALMEFTMINFQVGQVNFCTFTILFK